MRPLRGRIYFQPPYYHMELTLEQTQLRTDGKEMRKGPHVLT